MNEYLSNAEIAFSNKQYSEALKWYKLVIENDPNNIYALSRAGSICIPLGKFEDALSFFGKAKELEPSNGDVLFNYANACFFNKDYAQAFSMYIEAEKSDCSEDVLSRLYYQMAMLCSARQDIKSSLVYFDKCEKADREKMIAMNPDMISEKMKLYMAVQDYSNAEKCAAQLVAVAPTTFKSYMVYFSILMAHKDYVTADKVLTDALEYAEMNDNERFSLSLQKISLLTAKAESEPDKKAEYYNQAIALTEEALKSNNIPENQVIDLKTTLAELYMKSEQYDKSIELLKSLLLSVPQPNIPVESNSFEEILDEEIGSMIESDMNSIQDKIDAGELSGDLGEYSPTYYDEFGREVHSYGEDTFSFLEKSRDGIEDNTLDGVETPLDLSVTSKERIVFTLISCYLAIEDFQNVRKYSKYLRHSDNKYYSYYGLYTSTMAFWKTDGYTPEVENEYAKAIAFFRNKSFSDKSDVLALIFRARLYAECGKIEKAREIALLLSDADQSSVMDYIDSCQNR